MKRVVFLISLFVAALTGVAQEVDNFDVGPYEVDYRGEGDFKYRLRRGVDLYDYFGLKRDTVITQPQSSQPMKQAFHAGLFYAVPPFGIKGSTNVYGLEGGWSRSLSECFYFNVGLSLAFSSGKYNSRFNELNEVMFQAGVPLSVEFTRLDRQKASVYVGVGVVPTFYAATKAEIYVSKVKQSTEKESGFLVAPRIDFGGYVPVRGQVMRIGVFGQFNANCTNSDGNIFEDRIGRVFVGARVGLVF